MHGADGGQPALAGYFVAAKKGRMKETDIIMRIATARQGLAELSKLGKGAPARKIQVRQAVRLLSSVLGELETVVKDSKHVEGALYESENRFNTLLETATDGIVSIDDKSTIRYANPAAPSSVEAGTTWYCTCPKLGWLLATCVCYFAIRSARRRRGPAAWR